MSRKRSCTGVLLRVIDIGEADRFCIILTREYGRLAARARGARRAASTLPALLPGRTLSFELRESGSAFLITSVQPVADAPRIEDDVRAFLQFQHAAEALLQLLHDDEPVTAVFDDIVRFIRLCAAGAADPFPAYVLRLFATLGLLPLTQEDLRFARLSPPARSAVEAAAAEHAWCACAVQPCHPEMRAFADMLLREYANSALRVAEVARQFTAAGATEAQRISAAR